MNLWNVWKFLDLLLSMLGSPSDDFHLHFYFSPLPVVLLVYRSARSKIKWVVNIFLGGPALPV